MIIRVYMGIWSSFQRRRLCRRVLLRFWGFDCIWPIFQICMEHQFWFVQFPNQQLNQQWTHPQSLLTCATPSHPIHYQYSSQQPQSIQSSFQFGWPSTRGHCTTFAGWQSRFFVCWWRGGHRRRFVSWSRGLWWWGSILTSRLDRRGLRLRRWDIWLRIAHR